MAIKTARPDNQDARAYVEWLPGELAGKEAIYNRAGNIYLFTYKLPSSRTQKE
ncbi:MAG: hypothetical protein QM296_12285 [Bacillota bacterium]|nr:hypothetical protein [Bacillota bacterium]